MPSGPEKENVFTVNLIHAKEKFYSVRDKLTDELLVMIRGMGLLKWTCDKGALTYKELVSAYEANDEGRIEQANHMAEKLIEEFQAERSRRLRIFLVDANDKDEMIWKLTRFCESSRLVVVSGSMEDMKAVSESWNRCSSYGKDIVKVFAGVKNRAEDLQKRIEWLHEQLRQVENNVSSGEHRVYSDRDIRELISIAWEFDHIEMLTIGLCEEMERVERMVKWKASYALQEIRQIWTNMEDHRERFGGRETESGSRHSGHSRAGSSRMHVKYQLLMQIVGQKILKSVYIMEGEVPMFCRAKTTRCQPPAGIGNQRKWRPPRLEARLEIGNDRVSHRNDAKFPETHAQNICT